MGNSSASRLELRNVKQDANSKIVRMMLAACATQVSILENSDKLMPAREIGPVAQLDRAAVS